MGRKKPSSTVSTAASWSSGVHASNSEKRPPEAPAVVGNLRLSRSAAPPVIADASDSGASEIWETPKGAESLGVLKGQDSASDGQDSLDEDNWTRARRPSMF